MAQNKTVLLRQKATNHNDNRHLDVKVKVKVEVKVKVKNNKTYLNSNGCAATTQDDGCIQWNGVR